MIEKVLIPDWGSGFLFALGNMPQDSGFVYRTDTEKVSQILALVGQMGYTMDRDKVFLYQGGEHK